MHYAIRSTCAFFAMCRSNRHYAAGTVLARQAYGLSSASSRSHRVLGRTMSSRRSPPRGNSGGFAFEVVANPRAVLPAVLDEDLVGVVEGKGERGCCAGNGRGEPDEIPGVVGEASRRADGNPDGVEA